ncbi:MAG: LPS assembly lipoprotein LptE [Janthinobacterium lividum]
MRQLSNVFCLVSLLAVGGCGYHEVGAATHIPAGVHSIAVPIFATRVQGFRTETLFTQAVVRELNTSTRYRILTAVKGNADSSTSDADAVLRGTILTEAVTPLTYDVSSGQTSSYLVTITAAVRLIAHDGTVLYRNDAFSWREQYQSTQDLSGFVQEDTAAVRRLAHDFAQSLVSDMTGSFR